MVSCEMNFLFGGKKVTAFFDFKFPPNVWDVFNPEDYLSISDYQYLVSDHDTKRGPLVFMCEARWHQQGSAAPELMLIIQGDYLDGSMKRIRDAHMNDN